MLDHRRVIDARDGLRKRLEVLTAERDRLWNSQGGSHRRKQTKLVRLHREIEKVVAGIERLESLLS